MQLRRVPYPWARVDPQVSWLTWVQLGTFAICAVLGLIGLLGPLYIVERFDLHGLRVQSVHWSFRGAVVCSSPDEPWSKCKDIDVAGLNCEANLLQLGLGCGIAHEVFVLLACISSVCLILRRVGIRNSLHLCFVVLACFFALCCVSSVFVTISTPKCEELNVHLEPQNGRTTARDSYGVSFIALGVNAMLCAVVSSAAIVRSCVVPRSESHVFQDSTSTSDSDQSETELSAA
jgi:hypothetical protein